MASTSGTTTKDAASDARRAASAASGDVNADLEALRADIARLAGDVADLMSAKGNVAWDRAKSNVEGLVSDATAKGQEAVDAVREVSDNMIGAIDESLKKRPYTTLAIAVGIGFLLGISRR
jgi:ElaB/YqjD/DUF883 family membrane-anchored ribosome-binding protein